MSKAIRAESDRARHGRASGVGRSGTGRRYLADHDRPRWVSSVGACETGHLLGHAYDTVDAGQRAGHTLTTLLAHPRVDPDLVASTGDDLWHRKQRENIGVFGGMVGKLEVDQIGCLTDDSQTTIQLLAEVAPVAVVSPERDGQSRSFHVAGGCVSVGLCPSFTPSRTSG